MCRPEPLKIAPIRKTGARASTWSATTSSRLCQRRSQAEEPVGETSRRSVTEVGMARHMRVACSRQHRSRQFALLQRTTRQSIAHLSSHRHPSHHLLSPLPFPYPFPTSTMFCMVHDYNLISGRNHEGREP